MGNGASGGEQHTKTTVVESDMTDELQEQAIDTATGILTKFWKENKVALNNAKDKYMSENIEKELDAKLPG